MREIMGMDERPNIGQVVDAIAGQFDHPGFALKRLTEEEDFKGMKRQRLLDYRIAENPENPFASSSYTAGLEFDPAALRSQTYYIEDEASQEKIGAISLLIAPREYAKLQRYFVKQDQGVRVCDLKDLMGDYPEFTIIPGWTKIDEQHRGVFALQGLFILRKILKALHEAAPQGTCTEIVAQGVLPPRQQKKLNDTLKLEPGTVIGASDLPFDISLIGQNSSGSAATVKFAQIMGLKQIPNCGSSKSLGPVFISAIK